MPPQPHINDIKDQFLVGEEFPSGTPRRFFAFSLVSFVVALLVYFGLAVGYKAFLSNSIDDFKSEVEKLSSQISPEQQDNLKTFYSQISNVREILGDHVFSSQVFPLLEKNTHANVAYKSVEISAPSRQITIDGVAGSYDDLVSQLAIYENADDIENVILEESAVSGAVVNFKIVLTVSREVFDTAYVNSEPIEETNDEQGS